MDELGIQILAFSIGFLGLESRIPLSEVQIDQFKL